MQDPLQGRGSGWEEQVDLMWISDVRKKQWFKGWECKLTWRSRRCTRVKGQRAEAEGLPNRRKSEMPTPRFSRIPLGAQLSLPLTRRTNPSTHSWVWWGDKAKAVPFSISTQESSVALSSTPSRTQCQRHLHPHSPPSSGPLALNSIGLYGDLKPQFPLVSSIWGPVQWEGPAFSFRPMG